jgi:hypothetical protein
LDGLNKNENEQRGNSEKIVNRTPSELREIIKRTTSELRENHKLKREKLKIFTDFTTPKKRESLIRLFRMVKDVKANYADISDTLKREMAFSEKGRKYKESIKTFETP